MLLQLHTLQAVAEPGHACWRREYDNCHCNVAAYVGVHSSSRDIQQSRPPAHHQAHTNQANSWCCIHHLGTVPAAPLHSPAGTFNGEGSCTSVPQLPEGQSLSNSRSCVSSYPTRSAEGLLWVWADASPTALTESAAEDAWPGLAPEIDELGDIAFSRSAAKHKWYAR
jgi:hypothetical protein